MQASRDLAAAATAILGFCLIGGLQQSLADKLLSRSPLAMWSGRLRGGIQLERSSLENEGSWRDTHERHLGIGLEECFSAVTCGGVSEQPKDGISGPVVVSNSVLDSTVDRGETVVFNEEYSPSNSTVRSIVMVFWSVWMIVL